MVQFLNTDQSKGEVARILTNARQSIVIISPYIKFENDLISRLEDANLKNINIKLVCREKDLKPEERNKLEKLSKLTIYFNDIVHAKCYYNESKMVITSANLYESSKGDNHEMGVLLNAGQMEDKQAFEEAVNEVDHIIRDSVCAKSNSVSYKQSPPAPKSKVEEQPTNYIGKAIDKIGRELSNALGISEGHCIRCGSDIPLDTEKPLCPDCYRVWAKIKNPEYAEKFCHQCGKKTKTSMKKPICLTCFTK